MPEKCKRKPDLVLISKTNPASLTCAVFFVKKRCLVMVKPKSLFVWSLVEDYPAKMSGRKVQAAERGVFLLAISSLKPLLRL